MTDQIGRSEPKGSTVFAIRDKGEGSADVPIQNGWSIADDLSDQFNGDFPTVDDADTIGIFVESVDDLQFSVAVLWMDDSDDTVLGAVDHDIDSDLISSSPTNGRHYVYVEIGMAYDTFNVALLDESGAANHNVLGSIHIE